MTTNNLLLVITLLVTILSCRVNGEDKQVYIVYMGGSHDSGKASVISSYVSLLSSVLGSRKDAESSLVYGYRHAFAGFSAVISKKQASAISEKAGVVSVFPDPLLKLHTTRSWDFLQSESGLRRPSYNIKGDSIIGLVDTGVWPESLSFNDAGIGPVPSRWKGVCAGGRDFKCNRKIIGTRFYNTTSDEGSRDDDGHGTHTASIAAGSVVAEANYYGLANGSARGGSPTSRIAVYKVCSAQGCQGSAILAALDDAVHDGVDVISISLGVSWIFQNDFLSDPISIGAFHAFQKGILVVCSAGNEGPDLGTVVNAAPWVLTVAATTIDRDLESDVILGNGKIIKGEAINFSNLTRSALLPIVNGRDIKGNISTPDDASNCNFRSLNPAKVRGAIVVCSTEDLTVTVETKIETVKSAAGRGLVLIDDLSRAVAFDYGTFPLTAVSTEDGSRIRSYIKSTRKPVATILSTVTVSNYKPAPVVTEFSSRGPGLWTQSLLKPDIGAPGVDILASWIPANASGDIPPGQKPSNFAVVSGTSMAAPHVSGTAALLKAVHPTWSAAAIRSAIITTATFTNNVRKPVTNSSNLPASPFDFGAGQVNPARALNPGLIYDTTVHDSVLFLCNLGYNTSQITFVLGNQHFSCPSGANDAKISDLNYPTIAIATLKSARTIKRTLTNIGSAADAVYKLTVDSPQGLNVEVSPSQLAFSRTSDKITFNVTFTASRQANKGFNFGSFTWADGTHNVRSPFVVKITA
eukprot:PITA_04593